MTNQPEHSPLGASGAERWMHCPGSVSFLKTLELPVTDDPSYRKEGTAMHELAAVCLSSGNDTWEYVGQVYEEDVTMDGPMALHVQQYVDYCRGLAEGASETFIEKRLHASIHELAYGTIDFGAVRPDRLDVVDLKGGKGIVVDPDDNPQEKCYAAYLIDAHPEWPDSMPVRLHIVQPRAFHQEGPIRTWDTTVGEIREWVHDTLVPAMVRAEIDNELDAGPWCRFCPAKLVCPLLTSLFGTAAKADPSNVANLDDQSLGRSYQYIKAVEFYLKAMKEETLRRLLAGAKVPSAKLVNKKANRVWKDEAIALAREAFGAEAMIAPALKGPAAIEKLGPTGSQFVARYAFTPDTGFTVAPIDDPRHEVVRQSAQEEFAASLKAFEQAGEE